MLKLHGFASSNYYNVAKLALLEKGIPFEEIESYTGAGPKYRPEYLQKSPVGKVPCLETEHGFLSESRCIVQYLDMRFPEVPLFPSDPFERAKHDELYSVIELYLELAARRVLGPALGRGTAGDGLKRDVSQTVSKGVVALGQLARFDAFLTGETMRAVDVAACMHFPVVSFVMKSVFGGDPLAALPVAGYMERMEARPHVQRIRRDTQANFPAFMAHLKFLYG